MKHKKHRANPRRQPKQRTELLRLRSGQIVELKCDEPDTGHQWHCIVFTGPAEQFIAEDRVGLLRVLAARHPLAD